MGDRATLYPLYSGIALPSTHYRHIIRGTPTRSSHWSPEESDSDELDTRARTTGTSSEELATPSGMSCQEVSQSRRNVAANVRWRKRATHLSQSLRCQWRTKFNTRTARRETVFNMSRYHKSNACRVRYCFLHLSTNLDLDRSSVQSFAVRCLHKRKLIRVRCSRILRLM